MTASPRTPRLSASDELDAALHSHYDEYAKLSKTAVSKLLLIWHELEFSERDQMKEMDSIGSKAVDVWTTAVQKAEDRKLELMQSINVAIDEVHNIQRQLGDSDSFEFAGLEVAPVNFNTTLRTVHADVLGRLEVWRGKREQRTKEYESLQGKVNSLKNQLGIPVLAAAQIKPDISKANMEFLEVEFSKLQAERVRKASTLQDLLVKLDEICMELGEDARDAAAAVHSSLRLCMMMVQDGQPINFSEVSLSPSTFAGVEEQYEAKLALRSEREGILSTYMDLLCTLWEQLTVEEENQERTHLIELVDSSRRLHQSTLDKCAEETNKLEKTQAQVMRDLITTKIKELQELCHSTHIPAPEIEDFIEDREQNPGQIRDVLVKVISMLTEAGLLAEKRSHVIALIDEMEEARAESNWLRDYENDVNRFKGREANRNLQRSLKAAKMREKMQHLSASIRETLLEWRLTEGFPFLYDEQDYLIEVLDGIDFEIEQFQVDKMNKNSRRQSLSSVKSGSTPTRPGTAQSQSSSSLTRTPSKGNIKSGPAPASSAKRGSAATSKSAANSTPGRSKLASTMSGAHDENMSHNMPQNVPTGQLTPKRQQQYSKASRQGTFDLLSPRSPAPPKLPTSPGYSQSVVESSQTAYSEASSVQHGYNDFAFNGMQQSKGRLMHANENDWGTHVDSAHSPMRYPKASAFQGHTYHGHRVDVYRLPNPLCDVTSIQNSVD